MRSARKPPENLDVALARAQQHFQRAIGEALAGARALLDAASLAVAGKPAEQGAIGTIGDTLDELSRAWMGEAGDGGPLLQAVIDALDQEIGRWEKRSQEDPDARAVLRAFLSVREILWELGLRPGGAAGAPTAPAAPRPRVERFEIEDG